MLGLARYKLHHAGGDTALGADSALN